MGVIAKAKNVYAIFTIMTVPVTIAQTALLIAFVSTTQN